MFGTWFYHQRLRKSVAVFGTLFNNLYCLRMDSAGKVISQIKVMHGQGFRTIENYDKDYCYIY